MCFDANDYRLLRIEELRLSAAGRGRQGEAHRRAVPLQPDEQPRAARHSPGAAQRDGSAQRERGHAGRAGRWWSTRPAWPAFRSRRARLPVRRRRVARRSSRQAAAAGYAAVESFTTPSSPSPRRRAAAAWEWCAFPAPKRGPSPNAFCVSRPAPSGAPGHAAPAELLDRDGHAVDQVVATFYEKPRSYTAEDVVEISCHGAPVVLRHAVERALGRRRAPGRTRRIHPARLSERPHRPAAGRGRARPDRSHHALPGARGGAAGRGAPSRAASLRSRSSCWN